MTDDLTKKIDAALSEYDCDSSYEFDTRTYEEWEAKRLEAEQSITQAFKDAGWIKVVSDCSHLYVHDLDHEGHEGDRCEKCRTFRHMTVADYEICNPHSQVMTGKDWGEELNKLDPPVWKHDDGKVYYMFEVDKLDKLLNSSGDIK